MKDLCCYSASNEISKPVNFDIKYQRMHKTSKFVNVYRYMISFEKITISPD